jgi:UDP-3-O-[3-hydroxymyristoyl] N-acetylglucosamine deacetylase
VFRRVDLPEPVDIPINAQAVTDTRMASTIGAGGAKVHTVEHLMSACAGLGSTTCTSTSRPRKCPSSMAPRPRSCSCCKAPASSCRRRPSASSASSAGRGARGRGDQLKWARFEPYHGFKLRFEIDFAHPAVDSTGQCVEFDWAAATTPATSRARTFGFTKDVEMLRNNGLAWAAGWTTPSSWTTTRC